MNNSIYAKIINAGIVLLSLVILPLVILIAFGGVIAGIWLAILGEWLLVVVGLCLIIGGPFILNIPLAVTMTFASLGLKFLEEGNRRLAIPLIILNGIATYGIIIMWCTIILFYFGDYINDKNYIPLLLWIHEVATIAWVYMARWELHNQQTVMSLLFIQIGVVVMLIGYVGFDFSLKEIIITQIIIHSFGAILSVYISLVEHRFSPPFYYRSRW